MSFENPSRFVATQRAIRNTVEAGYMFHGINMAPTLDVAGYPGRSSAVNPAFRTGGKLCPSHISSLYRSCWEDLRLVSSLLHIPEIRAEGISLTLDAPVMHADVFEGTNLRGLSAQGVRDAHARFNVFMDQIRQATPEGGSYGEQDIYFLFWQLSEHVISFLSQDDVQKPLKLLIKHGSNN